MNTSKKNRINVILSLFCFILITSCSKNDAPATPPATVVKHWDIIMNAKYENPAPAGRTETGTAGLDLYSDNSFKYNIAVTGLAPGDALTASHIHFGDPATNGPVILNFNPVFAANAATATITGLRQTLVDSILTGTVYVNIHSTQFPGGLLRGQMDKTIDYAVDVALSGANEVPAVNTTATGVALLRLMTDKTLYSKITVTNLEGTDALSVAHIHGPAAAGVNAAVLQGLCSSAADFGIVKTNLLTDANVTALKTAAVYVNAHTTLFPGGKIRGQIR
ncbi:MAG: CHRD domain-containing protein [Chitinophagaceae bacterium]